MSYATGQIINRRYRIVRSLSQGGFGRLYRAWDVDLGRPCAIKQNLMDTPESQRQFITEAKLLANLVHPNLVRVLDYFNITDQGQFLVMDYIEGEDLQTILDRTGKVPPEQAIKWIKQVCDALNYIHSQNPPVIHRDIKPANIRIDKNGNAILVDFGIAKSFDPTSVTIIGARAVTPGFSPVEQYGMGRTNARTDIYALGATLYALLTGQAPPESVLISRDTPLAPISAYNVPISPAIENAIYKAMSPQPEGRFNSVIEFKAALETPQTLQVPERSAPTLQAQMYNAATLQAPVYPTPGYSVSILTAPARSAELALGNQIVLWLLAFLSLVGLVSGAVQVILIASLLAGDKIAESRIDLNDMVQSILSVLLIGLVIFSGLLFIAWVYTNTRKIREVDPGSKYSAGWAVGGFFIPFWNLIHPFKVVSAIWKSSDTGARSNPSGSSGSILVGFWWFFVLVLGLSFTSVIVLENLEITLDLIRILSYLLVIVSLSLAVASILCALMVRKIDQMQAMVRK